MNPATHGSEGSGKGPCPSRWSTQHVAGELFSAFAHTHLVVRAKPGMAPEKHALMKFLRDRALPE